MGRAEQLEQDSLEQDRLDTTADTRQYGQVGLMGLPRQNGKYTVETVKG